LTGENLPARSEGSEYQASPVLLDDAARSIVSPEDAIAFQHRLLRLLERRTAIYTMGDSTSVPKDVAVDLLRSVCFVLGIDPADPEVPERLLRVDLEDEFRRGLEDLERKVELAKRLWRDVCVAMPPIANVALQDTLASIGDFPKQYDFRSMAHEIPCSIDYPLCHPAPESLLGVDYINEYLRRLLTEADFLRRFELDGCVRVLERSCPDYVGLLVNLYEPIATNVIGRAVIGADPAPLVISVEERDEVARRLGGLSGVERERVMREAAAAACEAVGVDEEGTCEYLCALASELQPRIEVALVSGGLRGVFV
jgi:hypothetical protein